MWEEILKQGPIIAVLILMGGGSLKYLLSEIKGLKTEKSDLKKEKEDLQKELDKLRDKWTADKIQMVKHMGDSEHLIMTSLEGWEKQIERVLDRVERGRS